MYQFNNYGAVRVRHGKGNDLHVLGMAATSLKSHHVSNWHRTKSCSVMLPSILQTPISKIGESHRLARSVKDTALVEELVGVNTVNIFSMLTKKLLVLLKARRTSGNRGCFRGRGFNSRRLHQIYARHIQAAKGTTPVIGRRGIVVLNLRGFESHS